MSNVSTASYVCTKIDANNQCMHWQQTNVGVLNPQLVGIIIFYAFFLNLIVYGFRTMRRQL